jgi:sugar phosphate isomerase/epimerase
MKLAAQLYTLRDFVQTPSDLRETFRKVKEMGYQSVQLSAIGPVSPEAIKDYKDEFDLDICATHTSFDRIVGDTKAVIKEHKLWDCQYVGLGAMPMEYRKSEQTIKEFLDKIIPAAKEIRNEGLKFVYHNHRFEFEKFAGQTMIEHFVENTDKDYFGLLVDTYWVQAGGASPSAFIEKYHDRIDVIHLKDMKIVNDAQVICEVGEGNLDWKAIGEVSLKYGVEYAAVEQDTCERNPFDCLKTSFDNIKKMGFCTI